MSAAGWVLVALPLAIGGWAYLGYPAVLALAAALRRDGAPRAEDPPVWPTVSISLPAHDEEASIGRTLESLLALDYPAERRQIVVVSDASTDRTDEIVRGFADRGVELIRLAERGGKTAAENAAIPHLRGEIVVNTDATIRIPPGSLKPLVRAFHDPEVGCASGRDVSVGDPSAEANVGESGYVGYEMWVRSLETRVGSIVGASGCYYAIRAELHRRPLPEHLSRDFAAALVTREAGLRAVSVDEAVAFVPRTPSLHRELRRKVRTMARGMETLWHKRGLLNPFRHGGFALMLASHKVARWLVPPAAALGLIGLALLAPSHPVAALALGLAAAGLLTGLVALRWPEGGRPPRIVAICGYLLGANLAAVLAWRKALSGEREAIWSPTRRGGPQAGSST